MFKLDLFQLQVIGCLTDRLCDWWLELSEFQMIFDKMAAICLDFKWLGSSSITILKSKGYVVVEWC